MYAALRATYVDWMFLVISAITGWTLCRLAGYMHGLEVIIILANMGLNMYVALTGPGRGRSFNVNFNMELSYRSPFILFSTSVPVSVSE